MDPRFKDLVWLDEQSRQKTYDMVCYVLYCITWRYLFTIGKFYYFIFIFVFQVTATATTLEIPTVPVPKAVHIKQEPDTPATSLATPLPVLPTLEGLEKPDLPSLEENQETNSSNTGMEVDDFYDVLYIKTEQVWIILSLNLI